MNMQVRQTDPEKLLWQRVLEQAFVDATHPGGSKEVRREQPTADAWVSRCGKDFRFVCTLAGMDADFLSDNYRAGRFSRDHLKAAERDGR